MWLSRIIYFLANNTGVKYNEDSKPLLDGIHESIVFEQSIKRERILKHV